jgi:hypothetical protein
MGEGRAGRCPDGGYCHGDSFTAGSEPCAGVCYRVRVASPLSGVFPGDRWPAHLVTEAQQEADEERGHAKACRLRSGEQDTPDTAQCGQCRADHYRDVQAEPVPDTEANARITASLLSESTRPGLTEGDHAVLVSQAQGGSRLGQVNREAQSRTPSEVCDCRRRPGGYACRNSVTQGQPYCAMCMDHRDCVKARAERDRTSCKACGHDLALHRPVAGCESTRYTPRERSSVSYCGCTEQQVEVMP